MKQYILSLSIVFGMMLFASCSEEERTIYEGNEGVQALFQVKSSKIEVVEDDSDSIRVQVYRANTKDAVDVDVALTFAEGSNLSEVFTLASTKVSFADGENVAEAFIEYDFSKFGLTDVYKMVLSLTNEDQYPLFPNAQGAYTSINVEVKRKLTFETVAIGVFNSTIFGEEWDQELAVAKEDPNVFSLTDCYVKGYNLIYVMDDKHEKIIQFDKQESGYVEQGLMFSVELIAQEVTASQIKFGLEWTYPGDVLGSTWETFVFPKEEK